MKRALEQLQTIRQVTVTRNSINQIGSYGYEWYITFIGHIGNLPSLYLDQKYLNTNLGLLTVKVDNGDNSINTLTGLKLSNAIPGEMPAGYNNRIISSSSSIDTIPTSYTITNLKPGTDYYISVSAINNYGIGPISKPITITSTPPKQKPQPPTDVSIDVNYGSSSTLLVSYNAPLSDGGDDILKYRIELDTVEDFSSPIYTEIPCSTSNIHTVYEIKTNGLINDPIVSGNFKLQLNVNKFTYITDYIPYNAVALKSDEIGYTTLIPSVTVTATDGSDILIPTININTILFVGDRIQLSTQLYNDEIYTIVGTNGITSIVVDKPILLPLGSLTLSSLNILRYNGGRGTITTSFISCMNDNNLCPLSRQQTSGSIESKLEFLSEAIINGVNVDRDELPDSTNGYTWRVTFLDNSPNDPYDFTLSVYEEELWTKSSQLLTSAVTITRLVNGISHNSCVGSFIVPTDKVLTLNTYYYARVFAYNSIGYSFAAIAPTGQKPMVVPGPPTLVVLTPYSRTQLKVTFNPPISDGGDTITSYLIEYSIRSDYSILQTYSLNDLSGLNQFTVILNNLEQGIPVFVRVKAKNSQGYGLPASSTPSSLQPYESSNPPTNVKLSITSNSMLTVSWSPPTNNGGDDITSYIVEWDTVADFNGVVSKPNKDKVILDATKFSSYTITSLTEGRTYYVRVFAKNSANPSQPALTSPSSAKPSLQVPGKPHTLTAVSGSLSGQIFLTWQYPRIPWHGYPCSGTPESPDDCPVTIGGSYPTSNGGTPITEYLIEYNERIDFKGYDSGQFTTTGTSYTLQQLTPGRVYYIRILARNEKGSGLFCSYSNINCLLVTTPVTVSAIATN